MRGSPAESGGSEEVRDRRQFKLLPFTFIVISTRSGITCTTRTHGETNEYLTQGGVLNIQVYLICIFLIISFIFYLIDFLLHNHVHFSITKCCYMSQLHIWVETWVPLCSFYICTHYFVVNILLVTYTKYINFISKLRLNILLAAKLLTIKT